jgi:hypothetical protein
MISLPNISDSKGSPLQRSSSAGSKDSWALPKSFKPGPHDVICARGKFALENEGNKILKRLVRWNMQRYSASSCKFQKSAIVSSVVDAIRQEGGDFVRFRDDAWVRASDRHAKEKVGKMFRDSLHTKYRSSTKAKAKARRERAVGEDGSSTGSSSCNLNVPEIIPSYPSSFPSWTAVSQQPRFQPPATISIDFSTFVAAAAPQQQVASTNLIYSGATTPSSVSRINTALHEDRHCTEKLTRETSTSSSSCPSICVENLKVEPLSVEESAFDKIFDISEITVVYDLPQDKKFLEDDLSMDEELFFEGLFNVNEIEGRV